MTRANSDIPTYSPNLKGRIEMALRYRIPLPGPFYYSGRVGPKHWLPRSSHTGTGLMGFTVKWFIVYPSVVFFGVGLAVMLAPFYGLFWGVRRSLRNRRRCRPVAQCFPVQRPLLQRPAPTPVARLYGFVSVQRPVRPVPYGSVPVQRERVAVEGGGVRLGSVRVSWGAPPRLFRRTGIASSVS